jgi:uncharacterized protein
LEIENTFTVAAAPDTVYAYLVDVNRVVGCVPGAQLSEVVDPTTFTGKVKIKVGPVTVSYDGTARIVSQDAQARVAAIEAEGRETGGPGSARATTTMAVTPEADGPGSVVRFSTDFTVVGRVAQFGRGIMEDVSKRIVDQMATCIRTRLETQSTDGGAAETSRNGSTPGGGAEAAGEHAAATATAPEPAATPAEPAAAIDALALARGVAGDRLRRVRLEWAAGVAAALLFILALRRRRRRRRRG